LKFVDRQGIFLVIYNVRKSKKFVELMTKNHAVLDKKTKLYKMKYYKRCWEQFEKIGYFVPEYVKKETTKELYLNDRLKKIRLPPNITRDLYPYQIEGIKMLEAGWTFLGDMQGLGKTPQSCRFLELHKEYKTNIVICPGFLKEKWGNEIKKWTTKKFKILYGWKVEKLENGYTYLINYDILAKKLPSFDSLDIDCIVVDEIHFCKNGDIGRTKAMNSLAKKCKRFIPVTGTPLLNNPLELYNALSIIAPTQFYQKQIFENNYCEFDYRFKIPRFIRPKNEKQLYEILKKTILIRRDYNEVKSQFAGTYDVKIESRIVSVQLDSYDEYDFANNNLFEYVVKKEGIKKAKKISSSLNMHKPRYLKEIIYENKKENIFKWVDKYLQKEQKICLFFMRTSHLNDFVKRYGRNALKINGETKTEDRFEMCNMFNQSRRLNVLCGNIKACGVGLDLIGSHTIAFVDFDNNFSNMEQVIKRADRFGQKSKIVNVYYFAGKDTIEDSYIMHKLDFKNNMAKNIIDGRSLRNEEKFQKSFQ